ncbi:DsbC family protein [Guyparkeria sp.]|uniref:DsbC family protein n=1 Tax=Guyparkeria sp. TaxID=2035736 RepID=UPI00356237D5
MRKMPIAIPSPRHLLGAALAASLAVPFAGAMADEETITDNIQKHMPGVPIDSLEETPAQGIYELISNGQVAYVTADGKYLIAGDLIDVEQRRNLTQAKQDEQRVARLADIPDDRKLVYPAEGEKKHSITVLTDPTCPFCDKLHKEVPALQAAGVEVNYILTPRQGPGSKGFEISSRTLCADDPKQALEGAMKGQSVAADACRDDVVQENMALSNELGMSGTPYTILPNGAALPGYRPAKVMLEAIRSSDG